MSLEQPFEHHLKPSLRLRRPKFSDSLIERPRLYELLDSSENDQLILLHAPTGYGKSTLLNQWGQSRDKAVVWYNINPSDNNPNYFVRILAEGLELPVSAPPDDGQLSFPDALQALESLLNQLPNKHEEMLLVLDDYEHINNPLVDDCVNFFFRHLPAFITMAVISRVVPNIKIPELRAKGKLLLLEHTDLAFNSDEAEALLKNNMDCEVHREQVERLTRRTEGWVSAMTLAIQAERTGESLDQFISQIPHGHPYIVDYLSEELILKQPPEIQQFLYKTCILESFDLDFASQITGNPESTKVLPRLVKLGILSAKKQLGTYGFEYRYLQIVRYCVQRLLTIEQPSELPRLHKASADIWLKRGHIDIAAEHAIQAQDTGLVASILLNHGNLLYSHGQLTLLGQCLSHLPADQINRQPVLTLLQAWVDQGCHKFHEAESWLNNAEAVLEPIYSEEEWERLQADFCAVRAQLAINFGQADKALEFAKQAQSASASHIPTSGVSAQSVVGEVAFVQGQLDQAEAQMKATEEQARQLDASRLVLWSISQRSEISMARGQLQRAYDLQEKALSYYEENKLPPTVMMEFIHRIRGQINWEWHQLEEAEWNALQGLAALEDHGERWRLQSYNLLAKVALGQGKQHQCAEYIKRVQRMLACWDYHLDWVANSHSTLISYWEEVKDLDNLNHWLSMAPVITTPTNHFSQCSVRNRARALMALEKYSEAELLLENNNRTAIKLGLILDQNRNHIYLAKLNWLREERTASLEHLQKALMLASTSGLLGSFLRVGKPLIVMLKALKKDFPMDDLCQQRADRLITLSQKQRSFSKAIRITLDESIVQEIVNSPDVPELIRTSPLTKREWQVLSLIHSGLSNEQISAKLNVAPTTIKTHIRSTYQKIGVTNRTEAIQLASDLLAKIQGN